MGQFIPIKNERKDTETKRKTVQKIWEKLKIDYTVT